MKNKILALSTALCLKATYIYAVDSASPMGLLKLPDKVQSVIINNFDRQSLSRFSQVDQNTYTNIHRQNDPSKKKVINHAFGFDTTFSFNLDRSDKTNFDRQMKHLTNFLEYTNVHHTSNDIEINIITSAENVEKDKKSPKKWERKKILKKILPLCAFVNTIKSQSMCFPPFALYTPLDVAIRYELPDIAMELIELRKKVDPFGVVRYVNHNNKNNINALMKACQDGYEDLALALIDSGAEIDTMSNCKCYTPLLIASDKPLPKVVLAIIEKIKKNAPERLQEFVNSQNERGVDALGMTLGIEYGDGRDSISLRQQGTALAFQKIALALIDAGAKFDI